MGLVRSAFKSISGMVKSPFDSRAVLRPNGRTVRHFDGRIIGRFRRTGPNAWDKYVLEQEDGGAIQVYPSIEVQVEPRRARFRMRARGHVLMVQWVPSDEEQAKIDAGADPHELLVTSYVERYGRAKGIGVAAFIAKTLRR